MAHAAIPSRRAFAADAGVSDKVNGLLIEHEQPCYLFTCRKIGACTGHSQVGAIMVPATIVNRAQP